IGFAVPLHDADAPPDPSSPRTYMSWNGRFDLYRIPANFSTLVLPRPVPRPAPLALPAPPRASPPWLILLLALGGLGVFLLAGPGARFLARLGPGPKLAALGLTGLLALVFAVDASHTKAQAREAVGRDLAGLAAQADAVAREAGTLGALASDDVRRRERVLADLLRGQRVPCVLPPETFAYVPLRPLAEASRDRLLRYDLPLERPHAFLFPEPVVADRLEFLLRLPPPTRRDDGAGQPRSLGTITLTDGEGETLAKEVTITGPERETGRIPLDLARTGPWTRIEWNPTGDHSGGRLVGIRAGTGEDRTALPLSSSTEDGIPILGGPGSPDLGVVIQPETEADFDLPPLERADRLWLVLGAQDAFPRLLGDDVVAEIEVAVDEGEPIRTALHNAEHVVAEVLPRGVQRSPDMKSRIAYRWRDAQGRLHTHDAVAIRLDPSRPPRRLRIRNRGPAGPLQVVAATLVASSTVTRDGQLGVAPSPEGGIDTVFVRRPDPAFETRLGPGPEGSVQWNGQVGSPRDHRTPLTLSAPLPPHVAGKRDRTRIALLVWLAVAVLTLAF
ncbi:MAG: hypothetical protein ACC662_11425, partial [Planctomycetota bacterium]